MRPKEESYGNPLPQNGYRREYATMESYAASIIKVITLRRRGNAPLGFSIRGGWEHGTGVFISEIIPGSIAQKQGLRVGDQIVRINGFSIHRAIHMEVLSLLKTCPGIVLKIKRVGILPVKERDKDPVTWKTVEPSSPIICSEQVAHSRVNGSTLENSIIVKVEISVPGSASLGCSIAKGPKELPGIFMCTVKEGGIADEAGLEVGDQILDMNGTSFHDLKLNEAVALMKSVKDIRLTVKKGAGISLFLDNASQLSSSKNEDSLSTTRSLSDGITLKEEPDLTSCSSSKSSSFQSSSDSEKDYSISEESAGGGGGGGAYDAWIQEEKRALEEDRRRLQEEKRRLEEEKRALEEERRLKAVSVPPPPPEEPQQNSFLDELQKVAARMNSNGLGGGKETEQQPLKTNRVEVFKGKKCKEDTIKRMQHEMLMEEFREAHRKMFGQQPDLTSIENGREQEPDSIDSIRLSLKSRAKPPPPPPKTAENNNNKECQKITVNGQVPVLQSVSLARCEKVNQERVAENPRSNTPGATSFKVTVTEKSRPPAVNGGAPKSKSALVEVTPWTTRL